MTQKELSDGERKILTLVQQHYGPLNTENDVAILGENEAVIWAKDAGGSAVMIVHLTNLAEWLADGTIADEAELLRDWLKIQ